MIDHMQPEARLVRAIQAYIASRGGRSFKIQGVEGSHQEVGIPDLLVCFFGQFVGLEVKTNRGRLRPAQRLVLQEIKAAGGVAGVVKSVKEVEGLLDQLLPVGDLAWIAGFFDGEGYIQVRVSNKNTGHQRVYVSIGQKDVRPLEEISRTLGMGRVNGPYKTASGYETYRFTVSRKADVVRFITIVGPYIRLSHRRLKLEEACDILSIPVPVYYRNR